MCRIGFQLPGETGENGSKSGVASNLASVLFKASKVGDYRRIKLSRARIFGPIMANPGRACRLWLPMPRSEPASS
jgi:hypothetical protein